MCATCRSYQSRWRNHLEYAARVTAFFVAAASLLVWAVSSFPAAWKTLFAKTQVRVLTAYSHIGEDAHTTVVIANTGDREVFVSHVYMMMDRQPNWVMKKVAIDKPLAPGQFLRHVEEAKRSTMLQLIRNVSDDEWERVVRRALDDRKCYSLGFYAKQTKEYEDLRTMAGVTLRTFEARGQAAYYTVDGEKHDGFIFPMAGVVLRDTRCPST
jgi:hypothetical protein